MNERVLALKDGVRLTARHFDPEFAKVFRAILEKWPLTDDGLVWITSGDDSHKTGLHTVCRAVDVRTRNVSSPGPARLTELHRLVVRLQSRLGAHFDILFEKPDQPDEHIHIELDPEGV